MPFQRCAFRRLDANLNPLEPPLYAQFNPTEMQFQKSAQIAEIAIPGLDTPLLQFVRLQDEKLTLQLFFDTTDTGMDENAKSVTLLTDPFYELLKIDSDSHAPPRLAFSWGSDFPGEDVTDTKQQRSDFRCIVESCTQHFTLISPSGTPLRAKLDIVLREYKTIEQQVAQLNLQSADVTKSYVVQSGDTLPKICYQAYNDPTAWRIIADANNIVDPTALVPGTVLSLPAVVS
ncbi:MAG TPA: LysM peptidoglycan-binding domain-containing protein [Candidatus Acidoferrales bacterium]|nr:LysM peptidoglycan-binding domain-containing protein [Candidatus Acidoferrales bacterium]